MTLDTSDMTPVGDLTDPEDVALAQKATRFLTAFRWCTAVNEAFLAFDSGYIIGVFLFRIEPRLVGVDDTLWVVVGDGPPAFLVCDNIPDWHSALRCYIYEMRRWVNAVRTGSGLKGVIPVNVSPTLQHADMLWIRLKFIEDYFIDDKPLTKDRDA